MVDLLNKDDFLKKFKCSAAFDASNLSWDTLSMIYDDYVSNIKSLSDTRNSLLSMLVENAQFAHHSIHGRVKDSEHLIEKIIRKVGIEQSSKYIGINVNNYRDIVKDLIGVRILSLNKENWEEVYMFLQDLRNKSMIMFDEEPIAYTRYGDRDIYSDKIREEHTNKGYRSQHYIIKYRNVYCEIQARTLAEEVYGEFDHKIKYPYRDSNNFLRRVTSVISQHLDAVDEIISTYIGLGDNVVDLLGEELDDDLYLDWSKISKPQSHFSDSSPSEMPSEYIKGGCISVGDYVSYSLLRKGIGAK